MQSFKNRMDVVIFLSFTHKPEVCLVSTESNLKVKLQKSNRERTREHTMDWVT